MSPYIYILLWLTWYLVVDYLNVAAAGKRLQYETRWKGTVALASRNNPDEFHNSSVFPRNSYTLIQSIALSIARQA